MPANVECAPTLQLALRHIESNSDMLVLPILEGYLGCNKRHRTCPYKGEDCAVQDVIRGLLSITRERMSRDICSPRAAQKVTSQNCTTP